MPSHPNKLRRLNIPSGPFDPGPLDPVGPGRPRRLNIPSGPFDPGPLDPVGPGRPRRIPDPRRGPRGPRIPSPRELPPSPDALDAPAAGGAGQGFLTPFGQDVPQRFRGAGKDFIGGGRGASAFARFQWQLNKDPGQINSQIISAFPKMKKSVLNMSPFQKFMFMQRARRQNRRIKRGPGRPPRRPRLTNLPDFPSGTFDPNGPSIPRF